MRRSRKTGSRARAVAIVALAFVLGLSEWQSTGLKVNASSTGNSALLTIQGSGAGTSFGDYVSDAAALDTSHHYFIEVPPGLSRLKVEIFDADVGLGGTAEADAGRDRERNSAFDTSVNYAVFNPSGAQRNTQFKTGDASGPAGSDNAWLPLFDSTSDTVRDNFTTASYSNNDGLANWSTNWIETNDDNNAGAGLIRIVGGELRIQDDGDANPSTIHREANLSGFTTATLSFDFHTATVEVTDTILVQVSGNGGASWTTLETFTGAFAASSRSYNISSFIAANTRVRFITSGASFSGDDAFFVDNVEIKDSAVQSGHWEVRVDSSSAVTSGDDINAFGIRANDGDATSGGTELNIYADSFYPIGVNPPASGTNSRSYTMYPYISSGCSCSKNDFDYDSDSGTVGSINLTSRTGAFTKDFASSSLSTNNTWRRDTVTGWASDTASDDYGIWTAAAAIDSYLVAGAPNGNLASIYFSNFLAGANPPTANPQANALRIYLPTDSGPAPVKPYVQQRFIGPGSTIPVGQTATVVVWLQVSNPTAHSITFSATNLVSTNIPGSGAVYGGINSVSQGSIVSQPAINGTGNLTWNPGTLAAGANAEVIYYVKVSPTSAGQRIPITGTPASGNGCRARFVDETGNTTQARATFQFGPLCELAVTQNLLAPISYPAGLCNMSALSNGTIGTPYDQTIGSSAILLEGSLPPGLSISGSHLMGTPSTGGTFNFSLAIGNAGFLCIASRAYAVTISAPTASDGTISGDILDGNGKPVEGAGIRMSGTQNRLTVTDANGHYHFDNVETNGFYTLAPSRANFIFSPSQRSMSLLGQQTNAAFHASFTGAIQNPLDTTEYFVRQQYLDFLNREPDEAGLGFWYNNVESCGTDAACRAARRVSTSAAFFLSIEFQQTGYLAYRTFLAAYGNRPQAPVPITLSDFKLDAARLGNGVVVQAPDWETMLSNNKQAYMKEFVQRLRFVELYPASLSPPAFVDQLFSNAGITPDESDRTAAISQFGFAETTSDLTARARALQMVAENSALAEQQFNQAFVLMQYFGYLRRDPESPPDTDFSGYNFWLEKLDSFNGNFDNAEMVKSFLMSAEYRQRFPR